MAEPSEAAKWKHLKKLFEQVENKENWRDTINTVVPADADLDGIREAVMYFTCSTCQFTPGYMKDPVTGKRVKGIRVKAAGYWATME